MQPHLVLLVWAQALTSIHGPVGAEKRPTNCAIPSSADDISSSSISRAWSTPHIPWLRRRWSSSGTAVSAAAHTGGLSPAARSACPPGCAGCSCCPG
jgi:hypothetical protein